MEYKYLAMTIIIGISLYIAYTVKKYGNDKIRFHYALIDFITYIKNQISFFCMPTEEILTSYSDEFLEGCGFLKMIEKNQWKDAVHKNPYLDSRGKALLCSFGSKLGKSGAEEQIANCDYTLDSFNKLLDEYKENIPKKYKSYSSLAVIFGFMIIILLI